MPWSIRSRRWADAREHPDSDLVVLIADALHNDVVRPYLEQDQYAFERVKVTIKEYTGVAWLWMA